jgi:hypothetical protein
MNESDIKSGVISKGLIRRVIRKASREQLGATSIPFIWSQITLPNIPIKNQGSSSSCGGQAGSYWIELVDKAMSNDDIQFSAKSIYSPIAYPKGGTTVTDLQNQITNHGANFESDVPSYYVNGTTDESFMYSTAWMTPALSLKALRDAGRVAINVPIDMESIAQAIRDYGAVIIEIAGQNNGTWLNATPTPPSKINANPLWYHFICGTSAGMLNGQKVIAFANSWGQIGDNGFQYLTEDYVNSGYVIDCFTFRPKSIGGAKTGWLWNIFQWMLHKFS